MTFVAVHQVKQADKVRRLATILEDANDAIAVLDMKGRILAWNRGVQRLHDWTESEALQINFADIVPKDRPNEFREIVDKVVKSETIKSFKTRRLAKYGKILDIWLTPAHGTMKTVSLLR
jgi:two-component system CheB/CheR fusion protein